MKKLKKDVFLALITALLLIYPLGQLTKLPLGLPLANVYCHDIIIFLFLFFWLTVKTKKINWSKLPLFRPIIGFAAISLISLLINLPRWGGKQTFLASLYLFRWTGYAFFFFALFHWLKEKKQRKTFLLRLMIVPGLLAAALGILQYFLIPDLGKWTVFGWDPHLYRVFAPYFDPGFTGAIYFLALTLIVSFYWDKLVKQKNRKIIFLAFLIYLALALTYSRSAYLAFLISMAVISRIKKQPRFFYFCFLLMTATVLFLPRLPGIGTRLERKDTVLARIENWQNSLLIAKQSPLIGIGFNNYRWAQKEAGFVKEDQSHSGAGADSSLLFVLATGGIFGLLAYLNIFYQLFKRIRKKLKQRLPLALLASGAGLLIHSFFNNSLFYSWIMIWGWFLAALAVVDDG